MVMPKLVRPLGWGGIGGDVEELVRGHFARIEVHPLVSRLSEAKDEVAVAGLIENGLVTKDQKKWLHDHRLEVVDLIRGDYPYHLDPAVVGCCFRVWNSILGTAWFPEETTVDKIIPFLESTTGQHIDDIQFQ